jgi:transcriptional regulator with XRE-family HTH domain
MTAAQKFYALVREKRKAKRWTQVHLQEELNKLLPEKERISRQWVANLENMLLKKPMSFTKQDAICKTLEISQNEIPGEGHGPVGEKELDLHDCLPLLRKLLPNIQVLTFGQVRTLCEADYHCKQGGVTLSELLTNIQPTR